MITNRNVNDLLDIWSNAKVSPVLPSNEKRHSTNAYFNACPESPDGNHVLYFSSTAKDAHVGDICIRNRTSGEESVLARNVVTEDAHRGACQQWSANGSKVSFHNLQDGTWTVSSVDIKSYETTILAHNRQLGFGSAFSSEVPLYGCHWNPGEHRHLEMVNVNNGTIRKAVDINCVINEYGAWIDKTFEDRNVSVFFPVVSPDGNKVFFKIARGRGGDDFHSMDASYREGKVVFDLKHDKFICLVHSWGHPSWHPDSNGIFEKGNYLYHLESRAIQHFAQSAEEEMPSPSDHPTISPDGLLFVTDGKVMDKEKGKLPQKGIFVATTTPKSGYITITSFPDDSGADSWRPVHPHPVFSHDGKRIYFNNSSDTFSRLYFAEIP